MPTVWIILIAFVAGSIPFSNIAAQLTTGTDLRRVGTGTVSGTGLYRVAGFGPLALAGIFDVAKGAIGPLLAGSAHPALQAVCGALAVAGHDWSPWLRGAGGRGVSTAMGALAVIAWPGSLLLLAGLAFGRALGQTALLTLVAIVALVPVLSVTRGSDAAFAGALIGSVMLVKRLAGNAPPADDRAVVLVRRLLYDRDTWHDPLHG